MVLCNKTCRNCGMEFIARSGVALRCDGCRTVTCEYCGRTFMPQVSKLKTARFCSKTCRAQWRIDRWQERFYASIQRGEGCWEWQGSLLASGGYGAFTIGQERYRAHRLAYELEYGSIPEGLSVLHKCDNPPCCRPSHLFMGTQAENMADMAHKGRHVSGDVPNGERHYKTQLTAAAVRNMREQWMKGRPLRKIAEEFNLEYPTAHAIVSCRNWRHVE